MPVAGLTLNEIYSPVKKDLESFSDRLKGELSSEDPLIRDIHAHILKMSGKFLRPALTLLSSKIGTRENPDAVKLAVAIELIHTATLVHDDIIDNSDLRRNQPSIHAKWGREISIVAGDYLYAKAFMMLADLKDPWLSQALSACAHVMCEGEMKQIETRRDFLMKEAVYLKIIHQKTAALFQAACMGGAYFSGADPDTIKKMGDYGYRLGMAFQIVDDCLDLVGETERLGKNVGLDIYKNDVTLPLLYLFQDLEGGEKRVLLLEIQNRTPRLFGKVRALAIQKKSVERAMARAHDYVQKGLGDLAGIPGSAHKESLAHLAQYCLERFQ
ncbi:MAG: polyprenyl synthetase family protein [Candidatus Omnitrophica bacterium]|nr:polyprenyl synthetase family protein [Candidatus Omnitrophota bacterium]